MELIYFKYSLHRHLALIDTKAVKSALKWDIYIFIRLYKHAERGTAERSAWSKSVFEWAIYIESVFHLIFKRIISV